MEVHARDILGVYTAQLNRHRFLTGLIVFGVVGASIAEVIAPLYYKQLFDVLSVSTPGSVGFDTAWRILVAVAGVHIASWTAWRIAGFATDYLQPRIMANLEQDAFRHLMGHSYAFFGNAFTGALVRRVHRLSRAFESLSDNIEFRLLPLIVTTIGALIILWMNRPLLAVIMAVWIAAFLPINYAFSRWKLKYDVLRAQKDTEAGAVLSDAISNSVTVKLFNGFTYEDRLFTGATNALRDVRALTFRLLEYNNAIQGALMIGIEFVVTYYALQAWSQGLLTLGDFALIQGLLITMFNKLWDFGRVIRDTYEAMADAKEMVEVLKTPHEIRNTPTAKTLFLERGTITFKDVAFSYNQTRRVLSGFNLHIKPREKVAFVGPSGAGKSTVFKLLLRLLEIDNGEVLIDGQSVQQVTQESLRNAIALVPQEPVLFHRSLMENIRYGRRNATDAEVIAAAQRAYCHDFIMDLPQGYDTYVGERGVKLSGGERQRIAIARTILKDAPILLLDEATSSLDSESEALIQNALEDLMRDKTVLVIAHRLSTILKMDRIVVVEQGSVSAAGTHRALLRKSKTYKKLWKIQAGGFIP